ncbi:MAG: hypothetical protein L6R30_14120 [Thermoanaerobaculia bacterium]|nr:hypothetical protein [Thermoanaerobaculia bacterium]
MADRKKMTTISFSLGDELLDAVTEDGRTKAVPVTFEDDAGARSTSAVVGPVRADETPVPEAVQPARSKPRLRLVR